MEFASGNPLENDEPVKVDELAGGITTTFDAPVLRDSFLLPDQLSKPVIRVELELPWPLPGEVEAVWPGLPVVGFHTIVLADTGLDPSGDRQVGWFPTSDVSTWLRKQLFPGLREAVDWKERPLLGRLIVEGWAIVGAKDPALHVNGHADAEIDGNGRTRLRLLTTDEITGGRFTLWFWLVG